MIQKINHNIWFHLVEQTYPIEFFDFVLVGEAYVLFVGQWLDILAKEPWTRQEDRGQADSARGSPVHDLSIKALRAGWSARVAVALHGTRSFPRSV